MIMTLLGWPRMSYGIKKLENQNLKLWELSRNMNKIELKWTENFQCSSIQSTDFSIQQNLSQHLHNKFQHISFLFSTVCSPITRFQFSNNQNRNKLNTIEVKLRRNNTKKVKPWSRVEISIVSFTWSHNLLQAEKRPTVWSC